MMEEFSPVIQIYALNGGYVITSLESEEQEEQMSGFGPDGEIITAPLRFQELVNKSHVFVSDGAVLEFIKNYLTNLDSDTQSVEDGMKNG